MTSLCELVYKAKKIMHMSTPPRPLRRGDVHTHVKPQSWAAINPHTGRAINEIHNKPVMLFTAIETVLLDIYMYDNLFGGKAEIGWAFRPSLFVAWCEECETMWWMHQLPDHLPVWPASYFPPPAVFKLLESKYPRTLISS